MASTKPTGSIPNLMAVLWTLPDDIIYYMSREFIQEPSDLSTLSRTCHHLSRLLDPLLYRADILKTRREELETEIRLLGENRFFGLYDGPDFDVRINYQAARVPVNQITALHWAATRDDKSLGLEIAQKSIRAALIHWPNYLHVRCSKTKGMTPLQLAAKFGHEDMARELIEASPFVDARVYMRPAEKGELPWFDRMGCGRSQAIFNYDQASFKMMANALSIAIISGKVRIAEMLAHQTQELAESSGREVQDLVPAPKLAALHKMPSVIRILRARGYRSQMVNDYFYQAKPLHLAAVMDNNEETLQLLLTEENVLRDGDLFGREAIAWALEHGCVSNSLFLVKHYSLEERAEMIPRHFRRFLEQDDLLPVFEALLEGNTVAPDEIHSLKTTNLDIYRSGGRLGRTPKTREFLLRHPEFDF
ncbi:hypothetical protein F4677DRAFT_463440 [Hypoxylon crocopeplum]|nr:hypothetical protein F4677DRAFT_463440 [Hypoxylon crocopeplum]